MAGLETNFELAIRMGLVNPFKKGYLGLKPFLE
jgi:hypothetical protein